MGRHLPVIGVSFESEHLFFFLPFWFDSFRCCQVLRNLFLRGGSTNTVGRGLMRPIHDRQLREAAEGLAVCAIHKVGGRRLDSGSMRWSQAPIVGSLQVERKGLA